MCSWDHRQRNGSCSEVLHSEEMRTRPAQGDLCFSYRDFILGGKGKSQQINECHECAQPSETILSTGSKCHQLRGSQLFLASEKVRSRSRNEWTHKVSMLHYQHRVYHRRLIWPRLTCFMVML